MEHKQDIILQIASEIGIDPDEIIQRKDFLEFDEQDIKKLRALDKKLTAFQSNFVEDFYQFILNFDEMRQIIPDAHHFDQLKKLQLAYFKRLTSGLYDWGYVLDRLQVGLTHKRVGMDIKWYIGAYRKYLSQLINYIATLPNVDQQTFVENIDAVIKITSFDMSLAIDTYVHANNKKIKSLEQQLNGLIRGIDGLIWEFDIALNKYLFVSHQINNMLGYHQNQWLEDSEFQHKIVHPDDRERVKRAFNLAITEGAHQEIEYRIILKNNQFKWVNERITVEKNHCNELVLLRGLIVDIEKRKEYEKKLTYMATYDELTGLPNRAFFDRRLTEAMAYAKRNEYYLAIMFIDLDGFKHVNDSLGHSVGDKLLQEIGQRFKDKLREQEFAARFGGDEFCIILENIAENYSTTHVARRCLKMLERPVNIDGHKLFPRASIGIAMYPQDGKTGEILLQCADNAMYAAKSAGKHQFSFYNKKMTVLADQRLTLENDLRQALKEGEFELYYQPQVTLNTGEIKSVEALIRWHHPKKGMVPPDKFIPVAEEIGLIAPIGVWVLNQACKQMAEWKQSLVPINHIAINISGSHFHNGTLPGEIISALTQTDLQVSNIELEITESVMQTETNSIRNFKKIKDLGIKIAIDDFGTGYSCLGSLTQIPIDCLKIDKVFIQNALVDTNQSTIIATIIAMSRALGFSVVAEGVETIDQMRYLQGVGCDMVQGYYFSKPVPADKIPPLTKPDLFKI